MNERVDALLKSASELEGAPPASRRREALVQRAMAAGHTHEYADQIFDVATEEGVDPVVAFQLVLVGIGVRELAHAPPDQGGETQVEAPPSWVTDEVFQTSGTSRERLLRVTFRRLRSLLDAQPSIEMALRAFVREPDVGDVDY